MSRPIKYKTYLSSFSKGDKPCYWAMPEHNGTIDKTDMVKKIAARSGMEEETVSYIVDLWLKQVDNELVEGMHVEAGRMAGTLAVQGGFPTKDAPWDPVRNRLVANLYSKGDLSSRLSEVVCENVTEGATVVIKSVVDTVLKTESELAQGTNVTVYVAGSGLITSTDPASGEGVWLENVKTGLVAAVGTVTASTATTLNATFAEMPEPGDYRFVVATRGGYGSEYGVAQASRKVKVVAAD